MARPDVFNDTFTSGDTIVFRLFIKSSKAVEPLDLSELTAARYGIFDKITGASILEKTLGNGILIESPTDGILIVSLTPADTAPLVNTYNHELELNINNQEKVVTVFQGTIGFIEDKLV